jgi:hypothetical protein
MGGVIPESGPLALGAATPSVMATPEHESP